LAPGISVKISAIVLAAGASRRFGDGDKLASLYQGRALLHWALSALGAFAFHEILLVTRKGQVLPDLGAVPDYRIVVNPEAETGMASSIASGIDNLAPCDAAFVVLGDMPKVPPTLYAQLVALWPEGDIIQPVHKGQPGNPVLFAAKVFDDLKALKGDEGARALIASGRYRVIRIGVNVPGIHFDIDVAGG
jgi:molybdenum cofactor cytidylyltransferase